MGSVIRYGQWDADADTLGSTRFEHVRESIAGRAGATPGGPGNAPDWRDWATFMSTIWEDGTSSLRGTRESWIAPTN